MKNAISTHRTPSSKSPISNPSAKVCPFWGVVAIFVLWWVFILFMAGCAPGGGLKYKHSLCYHGACYSIEPGHVHTNEVVPIGTTSRGSSEGQGK